MLVCECGENGKFVRNIHGMYCGMLPKHYFQIIQLWVSNLHTNAAAIPEVEHFESFSRVF
jgi:hypothetical protein